jgi:hypothetical protein
MKRTVSDKTRRFNPLATARGSVTAAKFPLHLTDFTASSYDGQRKLPKGTQQNNECHAS